MLLEGDTLQLYLAEETMAGFMEEKTVPVAERHFGIVYEDDDILVVNKPAGLLTHPEKAEDRDTLTDQILYYLYEKGQYTPSAESAFTPAVCNRLDRNTSGIVVAGKTLRAVQAGLYFAGIAAHHRKDPSNSCPHAGHGPSRFG